VKTRNGTAKSITSKGKIASSTKGKENHSGARDDSIKKMAVLE
jgi:hypothetical protein